MVLSKNTFCWKNSLATHICPTQQKSIMLCDVDFSCICTHGRCHVMLTSLALTHMARAARCWPNVLAAPPGPQFLRKLGPDFHDTGPEIGARFPAKPLRRKSVPNLSRAWGESSLLPFGCKLVCLQLGQIRGASTAIHHHLLHSHPLRSRPDQIQNPKSKLQTGRLDFGFWILDFGVRSLDFGFWILDFGFWILDFWILDFGSWILDFGFWILDFGFWISLVFVLSVAAPNGAVWILDFGFWILEFGFWILDFGVWILDFGFWSLEFGFWILDFGVWILDFGFWSLDFGFWILVWMRPYLTSFGSCIRYFHVTPTRVGGFVVFGGVSRSGK